LGCEVAVKSTFGRVATCALRRRVYRDRMKMFAVLTSALAFATAALAESAPPSSGKLRIDLDQPAVKKKEAPKKVETKKDDGKKKKEDEIGKIEGIEIPHGKGFMGIQLVNSTFKLSFYDEKKKPTAPDVARAMLRWKVNYQPTDERAVLNPSGANALASPQVVRPPHTFKLNMTLLKGEGDDAASEFMAIDFHP
jgi:hypothetical protein